MSSCLRWPALLSAALLLCSIPLRGGIPAPPEIGSPGPRFFLNDTEGKSHRLEDHLQATFVVLMFISTQCPVSNDYNERMVSLHDQFEPLGITFLAINSNKGEVVGDIGEHATKHGFRFPVLKDMENVVADLYGAQVTPETYVLDTEGILRYHGRIDDSRDAEDITTHDLQVTLDALLAGRAVPRPVTKAFGCGIKRVKRE